MMMIQSNKLIKKNLILSIILLKKNYYYLLHTTLLILNSPHHHHPYLNLLLFSVSFLAPPRPLQLSHLEKPTTKWPELLSPR